MPQCYQRGMKILITFTFATFACFAAQAQTQFKDIQIGTSIDAVLPSSFDRSSGNDAAVRGAEVALYGPIDHLFDGTVIINGELEDGELKLGIEEGYVSTSKLIPQSRLRAGKFLLNFGRLNTFHLHDWPFTTAPRVFRELFSPGAELLTAESARDTGFEYTWLIPAGQFIEITFGAVNGSCWGECTKPIARPPHPTFYVHPSTFFEMGAGSGMLLGASYLKRSDPTKTTSDLMGIDLTYKKREGKTLKWLVQSEIFYQEQNQRGMMTGRTGGAYIYPEYGLNNEWSFGLRGDYYEKFNSPKENTWAAVPTITYHTSEFARFRLSYAHEITDRPGPDFYDRQIQLQYTFNLGSHPPHAF